MSMATQKSMQQQKRQRLAEQAWTLLFDPATAHDVREVIKQAFRNETLEGGFRCMERYVLDHSQRKYGLQLEGKEDRTDFTVALIMVDGYEEHRSTARFLYEIGLVERCVLIGYSSGLSNTRCFSNGASNGR